MIAGEPMRGQHHPDDVRVFVTMPAFRAERTIERTLRDLPTRLQENVILVDDASPDGTAQAAVSLGIEVVQHKENRGYGGNQKTCYTTALDHDADIVVMLHPDYQYDPKAVPLLIGPLLSGDADMTFGSRFAGLSDPVAGGMPPYRYIGNRVTTVIQNLLFGTRFTELHSGMRAYTAQFLRSVPFLGFKDGFEFDSQMMAAAISGGHRVVEVPIPTRYTEESSSIAIRASMRYVTHAVVAAAKTRLRHGGRRTRRRRYDSETAAPKPMFEDKVCVLCGASNWRLTYRGTASGPVNRSEFACTTSAVSVHDDIVDCTVCGLRSSVPEIADEDIIQNYREVVDEEYLSEEEARRRTFQWIVDVMSKFTVGERSLVEFGSNVGLFLDVASKSGWKALGVEPSRWAVQQGRSRFGVDLHEGTVETYETRSAPGAVVMLDLLEHVTNPAAVLDRVSEILDDTGILVLSTVDAESLHSRIRRGRWPWYIRSHLHYFTRKSLTRMLRGAGFELTEWRNVPRSFHLSYIVYKGGWEATLFGRFSRWFDPRIPAGWLGDVKLVVARPSLDRPALTIDRSRRGEGHDSD